MLIQQLNISGNKTTDEMDRTIERSKKVVYEPVILGIQTADSLKRKISIKMESQLMKETGHHVSILNLPNNSPLLSSPITPQLQQPTQLQRTTQTRKHMKKDKGKVKEGGTSRLQKKWSHKETTWLAKCFCDTPKNLIVGNSLKRTNFWGTVKEKFNDNECGWERMEDSLSSKWRDVNKACTKFFSIFKDIKDQCHSGSNDDEIYDAAIAFYKNQYAKKFNMKETFFFLMQHPKWNVSDAPVGKAQDDFENVGDSQPDTVSLSPEFENELFENMPIPRPMRRERAKKAARSSTSSDAPTSSRCRSSGSSKVAELIGSITRFKDGLSPQRNIALDKFTEYSSIQTALSCINVLEKSTADMPDPRDARRLENLKKLVRRKLKDDLNIDDNEDDDN
ncbi:uncharacterized protein [Rutidosis leptorrhynchoides]